ncbi:MAG: YciI family protein [Hyphomicrobiales bacterium]
MRYMFLIHENQAALPDDNSPEGQELFAAYMRFGDEASGVGTITAAERLERSATAARVSLRNGQVVASDGPYAETKEQLGGFYIIDCPDLDVALKLAAKIPAVERGGAVEVRPVWELGG